MEVFNATMRDTEVVHLFGPQVNGTYKMKKEIATVFMYLTINNKCREWGYIGLNRAAVILCNTIHIKDTFVFFFIGY